MKKEIREEGEKEQGKNEKKKVNEFRSERWREGR